MLHVTQYFITLFPCLSTARMFYLFSAVCVICLYTHHMYNTDMMMSDNKQQEEEWVDAVSEDGNNDQPKEGKQFWPRVADKIRENALFMTEKLFAEKKKRKYEAMHDDVKASVNSSLADSLMDGRVVSKESGKHLRKLFSAHMPLELAQLRASDRDFVHMEFMENELTRMRQVVKTQEDKSFAFLTRVVKDYKSLKGTVLKNAYITKQILSLCSELTIRDLYTHVNIRRGRRKTSRVRRMVIVNKFYAVVVNRLQMQKDIVSALTYNDFKAVCSALYLHLDMRHNIHVFRRAHGDTMRAFASVYQISTEEEEEEKFVPFGKIFSANEKKSLDPRRLQLFYFKSKELQEAKVASNQQQALRELYKSMYLGEDNMIQISSKETELLIANREAEKQKRVEQEEEDAEFTAKKAKRLDSTDEVEEEEEEEEEEEDVKASQEDKNNGIDDDDYAKFLEMELLTSEFEGGDMFAQPVKSVNEFLTFRPLQQQFQEQQQQQQQQQDLSFVQSREEEVKTVLQSISVADYLTLHEYTKGCAHYDSAVPSVNKNAFHNCEDNIIEKKKDGVRECRVCKLMFGKLVSFLLRGVAGKWMRADEEESFLNGLEKQFNTRDERVDQRWKKNVCWESLLKSSLFLHVYTTYHDMMYTEVKAIDENVVTDKKELQMLDSRFNDANLYVSATSLVTAAHFIVRGADNLTWFDKDEQKWLLPIHEEVIVSAERKYTFDIKDNVCLLFMLCPFLGTSYLLRSDMRFLRATIWSICKNFYLYKAAAAKKDHVVSIFAFLAWCCESVYMRCYVGNKNAVAADDQLRRIHSFVQEAASSKNEQVLKLLTRMHYLRAGVLSQMFYSREGPMSIWMDMEFTNLLMSETGTGPRNIPYDVSVVDSLLWQYVRGGNNNTQAHSITSQMSRLTHVRAFVSYDAASVTIPDSDASKVRTYVVRMCKLLELME